MSEVTAEMIERGRGLDPRIAATRRKRSAKVQSARERLTSSDTGHRGCDLALLRAYANARENSAISGSALIAATSLLSFYWLKSNVLLIWAVLTFSSLILCYGLAKGIAGSRTPASTCADGAPVSFCPNSCMASHGHGS